MDLTALIEFTAPGAITRVERSADGTELDPWPGIDGWTAADYQDVLDSLVTWAGAPVAGADVHGNIAAYLASIPAPAELAALRREEEANTLLGRAVDETFLDGFWLLFKKASPVGNAAIDDAIAADDRAAFNQFFKDQVKARL